MSDDPPPNPPPAPLPEDLEPPLLQDPPVRWPPEPPHEDQMDCDGTGHEFPPEAIELAEQAIDAASPPPSPEPDEPDGR